MTGQANLGFTGDPKLIPPLERCRTFPELSMVKKPARSKKKSISFSLLFLLYISVSVLIALSVFVFTSQKVSLPDVTEDELHDIDFETTDPISKGAFLAMMKTEQRKQFLSQVHYISEIIKSTRKNHKYANELAYSIVSESKKANYNPFFIAAIVKYESMFNRHAKSRVGARGLMQILPPTAKYMSRANDLKWKGTSGLSDPHYNLRLGIAYLKYLNRYFKGDTEKVLIAYNWGPRHLRNALKKGHKPPHSTQRYANNISNDFVSWSKDFKSQSAKYKYFNAAYISS